MQKFSRFLWSNAHSQKFGLRKIYFHEYLFPQRFFFLQFHTCQYSWLMSLHHYFTSVDVMPPALSTVVSPTVVEVANDHFRKLSTSPSSRAKYAKVLSRQATATHALSLVASYLYDCFDIELHAEFLSSRHFRGLNYWGCGHRSRPCREIKNRKKFSWRSWGVFAKICARENFPLYGIYTCTYHIELQS